MPDQNCDTWAKINFGRGPVIIRCTELGSHQLHRCVIEFEQVAESKSLTHNVFENQE